MTDKEQKCRNNHIHKCDNSCKQNQKKGQTLHYCKECIAIHSEPRFYMERIKQATSLEESSIQTTRQAKPKLKIEISNKKWLGISLLIIGALILSYISYAETNFYILTENGIMGTFCGPGCATNQMILSAAQLMPKTIMSYIYSVTGGLLACVGLYLVMDPFNKVSGNPTPSLEGSLQGWECVTEYRAEAKARQAENGGSGGGAIAQDAVAQAIASHLVNE